LLQQMTREGVMGGEALFQICYEGDLTIEVCEALRRLGAEPNFDQSWQVLLSEDRHAAPLVRYLRMTIGGDANILVARTHFTTSRDFLLVRHSLTPGADYSELHTAIDRLGRVLDLPFDTTFVIECSQDDVQAVGDALGELCPDDSLMVIGISHDFAFSSGPLRRMFVAAEAVPAGESFRNF
jgi:hypothetical protein